MVKRYFILVMGFVFMSCSMGYTLREGGLRPKNYKKKNYAKYVHNPNLRVFEKIDTSSVYVSTSTLYKGKNLKRVVPIDTIEKKWVYRFYQNGKYSYFNLYNSSISKGSLNPASGTMGFYNLKKNNEVEVITFVKTPSGSAFRKRNLIFLNDTLYREDTEGHIYTIFVKTKTPRKWIDWQPDW